MHPSLQFVCNWMQIVEPNRNTRLLSRYRNGWEAGLEFSSRSRNFLHRKFQTRLSLAELGLVSKFEGKQSFWHYCYFLKLKLGDFSWSQKCWICYVFVSFRFRNLNDVYSRSRLNNLTATFTLLEVIIVDLLHAIIHTLLVTHYEVHFEGILRVSLTFEKSSPWH